MTQLLSRLYDTLRLYQYKRIFSAVKERDGRLSATEAFSIDAINLLGTPSLGEFADFLGISQPNASYKVAALAEKGYLEKQQGPDRREARLCVTQRFYGYFGGFPEQVKIAVEKACAQMNEQQLEAARSFISAVTNNLRQTTITEE